MGVQRTGYSVMEIKKTGGAGEHGKDLLHYGKKRHRERYGL